MDWIKASDIKIKITKLVSFLGFSHIDPERIFCFRSFGSRSRARARIWSLPRIWQQALNTGPGYCIEVLSEKFDKLTQEAQSRVLIHELLHIPKNFSGSLLSHRGKNRRIDAKAVERLFKMLR